MTQAHLINRGEQFEVTVTGELYSGECIWSWIRSEEATPKRTYPVFIEADSIRRTGLKTLLRLTKDQKIQVAFQAAGALKMKDGPTSDYVVTFKEEKIQQALPANPSQH